MSTIIELLESRAKDAGRYVQKSKGAKLILQIAGAVKLNIETVEPIESASATINANEVLISHELQDNPHATIKGKSEIIKELIRSTQDTDVSTGVQSFDEAEKNGDVSIKSHGIKGRLIVSRVRKMLLG